jgi:hypothetical protein
MDFKRLTDRAKRMVDKRGGPESVKEDAGELKGIFKGGGSFTDKAKAAAEAVKEPGAPGADRAEAGGEGGARREPERRHGEPGHRHRGGDRG